MFLKSSLTLQMILLVILILFVVLLIYYISQPSIDFMSFRIIGSLIGVIVFASLLYWSTDFVWDRDVTATISLNGETIYKDEPVAYRCINSRYIIIRLKNGEEITTSMENVVLEEKGKVVQSGDTKAPQ